MSLWDKDKNKIKICIKWTSIKKNTLSSNIVNAINDEMTSLMLGLFGSLVGFLLGKWWMKMLDTVSLFLNCYIIIFTRRRQVLLVAEEMSQGVITQQYKGAIYVNRY